MISINTKDQTITVQGDADPVCVANQLKRKFKCSTIVIAGPPKETETKKIVKPTLPPPKPVELPPPTPRNTVDPPQYISVYPPCMMTYGPYQPYQLCHCSDCSSRWNMPGPGYHPPPPHTGVYYVDDDENASLCTIS